MDFKLDEDQASLLAGLEAITADFREIPIAHNREPSFYAHDLDAALQQGGFLDILGMEGFGSLEATLVTQHIAQSPVVVEAATTLLIAPAVSAVSLPRPFAIVTPPFDRAERLLSVAKTALFVRDGQLFALPVEDVDPVETIVAYPYGRFPAAPDLSKAERLGGVEVVAPFERRRRLAIAAEISGAFTSAVAFTNDYVKNRFVFGKPIGQHQAVQHRLAQCHQAARALEYLLFRAAWKDDDLQATYALAFAQQHVPKAIFDLHQFNGAMGITFEHRLHCWTFRMVALQAEMGGARQAGLDVAERLWGAAP